MSFSNARNFVARMREDRNFRARVQKITGTEDLSSFLYTEGLKFDQKELVEAMAECMEQLELQMSG